MGKNNLKWLFTGMVVVVLSIGIAGIALAQDLNRMQSNQISYNNKIEAQLVADLQAGTADFIVRFVEQADLSPAYQMAWKERGEFVYNTLRETARVSQVQAKSLLDGRGLRYQTFIAGNELYVWAGSLDAAQAIAALPEVDNIRATRIFHVDPVSQRSPLRDISWVGEYLLYPVGPQQINATSDYDWGILDTKADQFWSTFGFQGSGILVANIDTGVQWDHEALINQYKCNTDPTNPSCWLDPSNICGGDICDNMGHGTHTMGTMVASDDPILPYIVGMAPEAQWIACKGCEYNSCTDYALNACADWIIAPDGDPANRPDVVNNSWGGWGCNTWYLEKVNAWRAAGTFPAFSAGNGYGCNTLGSPGDYQESFGSTSHNIYREFSYFASGGPSCFGHDPYTKPNISAPGQDILSTIPGGWGYNSGTSMSSPHTAGAVALLWSCNPALVGDIDQTFQILQDNADTPPAGSCGAPEDGEGNYTFGYGYLDIYNAGLLWCGETGHLEGHVYDQGIAPIDMAHVYSTPGPYERWTDENGYYNMIMMTGDYEVTAEAYGYYPSTVSVTIITDTITVQDFYLTQAPTATVSGNVTDYLTGWPLYAYIAIAGYPQGGVWTDPVTGFYSVVLPEGGSYEFTATAVGPGYLPSFRMVGPLIGDSTEDFALDADLVSCNAPGYKFLPYEEDFEADNGNFSTYGYGFGADSWQWGSPSPYPGPGYAHSGTNVWATNLEGYYNNYEDSYLESPDIDLSSIVGQWFDLSWWQWLETEWYYDIVELQVSSDGGQNWSTVYGPVYGGVDYQWAEHSISLDPTFAVGNFRVRFHIMTNDWYTLPGWYVDDITIGTCQPQEGGLVVGNVYESNQGNPLTGALVSNDSGEATLTVATDDPAVDDAFYTLFSPAGVHDFTASYPKYNTVTEAVEVIDGDTVGHDFYLPAGFLVADPSALHENVLLGDILTVPLTMTNLGDGSATFELVENDKGWVPALMGSVAVPAYQPAGSGADSYAGQKLTSREAFTYQLPAGTRLATNDINVLLVAAADASQIRSLLQAYPDLTVVDFYDARYNTPSLEELLAYDNVVLISNNYFYDPTAMGNVLADYVDEGGTVVQTVPTFYGYGGWKIAGRFLDEGYSPFIGVGDWFSWSYLGDYDPNHPIMEGVTTASDYYRQMMELAPDAQWVASWLDDEFIATKGRVVALNTALFDGYMWSGDIPLIVHNSIVWLMSGGDAPWLSESPITGTIPAESFMMIDVTFDATLLGQPGDYLAEINVKNDTPYGPFSIPVTMTVQPPPDWGKLQGTVASLGYCDEEWNPLEGAQVFIQSNLGDSWMLETDESGYYSWWLSVDGNPYTIDVTYPEHTAGSASGVIIVGQGTTTRDFELRWLKPCVGATPPTLESTLELGESETLVLELTNTGAADSDFEIKEKPGGFIPTRIRGPLANAEILVPEGQRQAKDTLGLDLPAMPEAKILEAGDVLQVWYASANNEAWGIAYDGDDGTVWVGNGWSWDNTIYEYAPDGIPTGRSWPYLYAPTNGPADAAFNWNTGMIWITAVGDGDCIHEIDPNSGETGNEICPPIPMYAFRGLAYDPVTDTYFGGGWNDQSVYHFTADGTILEQVYVGLYVSGLAYNPDTMHLFVMVNSWDEIVSVLDVADNYALIGQFYIDGWPGYGNGAGLEIDCAGNLWAVAQYENNVYQFESGETADLCAKDVPWVTEEPVTGTLPADVGLQTVDVTFDSSMVAQPGIYHAELNVKNDDPLNGKLPVVITMTVTPPPDWGKLTGIVESLGYCDLNPSPLMEYTVVVDVDGVPLTATLSEAGNYTVWLEQGTYNVTASAEGHVPVTQVAEILAGEVTALDFGLRWIAPCISGLPQSYDVEIPQGFGFSFPFEVVNLGAGSSSFKFKEEEGTPMQAMGAKGTGEWLYINDTGVMMQNNQGETALAYPKAYRWTPFVPSAINVLMYADDYIHVSPNTFLDQALQTLGIAYTAHYDGDWWGFVNDLQAGGWDLVLIANDNWGDTSWFAPLRTYIQDGGKVIVHTWTVAWDYYNPLWSTLGFSFYSNDYDPPNPVYWWDPEHPAFTNPEEVPEFTELTPYIYGTYGQQVEPLADFLALAGYTDPGPDPNQAAMILGNENRTVFKGFLDGHNSADLDDDGIMDGVELWIDLIYGIQNGFKGGDVPWVSEDPAEGMVEADSSYPVDLTFTAFPTMTIGNYYTATLIINSDDPVNDSYAVPVTMTVIAPVIEFNLLPEEITESSPPGTVVYYELTVENVGNVPDVYSLSLENQHWPVLLPIHEISLGPGENGQFAVLVFIPASAPDGEMDVMTIRATSQLRAEVTAATQATTVAMYPRIPWVSPPTSSAIGKIGETVEYELQLGNFSVVSDTLEVTVDSVWPVFLSEDRFALDTHEEASLTVTVYIPSYADVGDMDLAVITVTSTSDPMASDSSKLYTNAEVGHIFIPVVTK